MLRFRKPENPDTAARTIQIILKNHVITKCCIRDLSVLPANPWRVGGSDSIAGGCSFVTLASLPVAVDQPSAELASARRTPKGPRGEPLKIQKSYKNQESQGRRGGWSSI
jgi:hypothetical protein